MTLDTMMECVARRLLRPAPGQQLPGSLLRGGNYPVHSLEAEEDRLVYDKDIEEEKWQYKMAQDGDHMMCPFQCDLCHFRNIQELDPGSDPWEEIFLMAIQRVTLDSFWAREMTTVNANHLQEKYRDKYGVLWQPRTRSTVPFPVRDDWGMFETLVCCTDLWTNRNTMQKLRSFFFRAHFTP